MPLDYQEAEKKMYQEEGRPIPHPTLTGAKRYHQQRVKNYMAIQNKNPESKVFSSGTTENLKSNNGHSFL
jgi:hypothetical protein